MEGWSKGPNNEGLIDKPDHHFGRDPALPKRLSKPAGQLGHVAETPLRSGSVHRRQTIPGLHQQRTRRLQVPRKKCRRRS
jgi:hypothetical protein